MDFTSSRMMFKKQFFRSRASQRDTSEPFPPTVIPIGSDMLPIKLRLFTLIGSSTNGPPRTILYDAPNLITEPQMVVSLSRVKLSYLIKRGYAKVMARHLTKMGVPEAEQPAIIGKIFKVVEVAVPRLPITVSIVDVTVTTPDEPSLRRLTACVEANRQEMLDVHGLLWEFMETFRVDDLRRHIDAVKQDFKLVRLDSLEAAVRQTPCFICNEELDEGEDHPNRIARLHCSHLYHLGCIVWWRTKSHLCPSCQHPIVDEPPKPYGPYHWLMYLASKSIDGGDSLSKMLMRAKLKKINPYHLFF